MITPYKTRKLLIRCGFMPIHVDTISDIEYWVTPISGRVLIIVCNGDYKPSKRFGPFGGIKIPFKTHDAFISKLCGELNNDEHSIIEKLI